MSKRETATAERGERDGIGGPPPGPRPTGAESTAVEQVVEHFAAGWRMGAGPEFFEHFGRAFLPDTLLEQPLARPARGPAGLRALFGPLFEVMPDLRGEVVRWGETSDGVLVELALSGTFGGRPIAWTVVDRIVVRDGKIAARRSYFDPLPLLRAMLLRPRAAAALLPALIRRKEPT